MESSAAPAKPSRLSRFIGFFSFKDQAKVQVESKEPPRFVASFTHQALESSSCFISVPVLEVKAGNGKRSGTH